MKNKALLQPHAPRNFILATLCSVQRTRVGPLKCVSFCLNGRLPKGRKVAILLLEILPHIQSGAGIDINAPFQVKPKHRANIFISYTRSIHHITVTTAGKIPNDRIATFLPLGRRPFKQNETNLS